MNTQEMFDKVVNHIRQQGTRCQLKDKQFGYIGRSNPCLRCAKGVLMDVNVHFNNLDMEWKDKIQHSIHRELSLTEVKMLNDLEAVFENYIGYGSFELRYRRKPNDVSLEGNFKEIAEYHGLIYNLPEIKNDETRIPEMADTESN